MYTISQRLKQALTIRNMRQIDLSNKTGIPKGSISQYVSGYVEPKQDRIYLLSNALNVSEAWLMGYDVDIKRTNNISSNYDSGENNQILEKIQQLDNTDKEIILSMIDRMLNK